MDELGRCKSPNRPRQEGEPIGSIGSTGAWLHPGTRGANPAQKDGRVLELRNKVMLATVVLQKPPWPNILPARILPCDLIRPSYSRTDGRMERVPCKQIRPSRKRRLGPPVSNHAHFSVDLKSRRPINPIFCTSQRLPG